MTTNRRGYAGLILGLILISLGALLLARNYFFFRLSWLSALKYLLPALLIAFGVRKLIRHFTWPEEELRRRPGRSSLLGGIFWTSLGLIFLLDLVWIVEAEALIGSYWPVLFIVFGAGKIVDFYRLEGRLQVRAGEVFGLIFVAAFGLTCDRLARAHFPLINWDRWGIPVSIGTFRGEQRSYEETAVIPAQDVDTLKINNIYGNVTIEGALSDSVEVTLTKVVRENSELVARRLADEVPISYRVEASTLSLGANRAQLGPRGRRLNTHLKLKVPAGLAVEVGNSFGRISVEDMQSKCVLVNSNGSVFTSNITGDLDITTSYRAVEVRDLRGSLRAENRRGSILVDQATGDVEAETAWDRLTLREIRGGVVARNHHGNIQLENISGEVRVEGTASEVNVSHADKPVYIQNSHRSVVVNDLSDRLELDTQYSDVHLSSVAGAVEVQAIHATITGDELENGVQILGRGSQITLDRIAGDIRIETSLQNVRVEDFSGSVAVQNEIGAVELIAGDRLGGEVTVTNRNGSISVVLPDSSFQLSALSQGGDIVSEFGEIDDSRKEVSFLETTVGSGGPRIELQTTGARIRIRKRG